MASSNSCRDGYAIKGGARCPTLSDLLADDVREYFLRESDCDHESSNSGTGGRLPQSREEGHPFRHSMRSSKLTQPYSYLSASSESDAESIDSGGVGKSSSTSSSSLFQGVTHTMTSDTLTSGGGWSNCSSEEYNSNHKCHDSFVCVKSALQNYSRQYIDNEDPELLIDKCNPSYSGENINERSGSTLLNKSNNRGIYLDSSDTTSLNYENHQYQQHDEHEMYMYHRQKHNQQTPIYQNIDVSDKLVRFHHSLELKQDSERNSLLGNGSGYGTYSSMNTSQSATETICTSSRRTGNCKPVNRRLGGPGSVPLRLDDAIEVIQEKMNTILLQLELFISNMPSLVGSLALAWCSLGVDWFKVRMQECYEI